MGVPVTPQARITAPGFTAYVDLLIDGEDVVPEFDGRVEYGRSAHDPGPFGHRRSLQQVLWPRSSGRTGYESWATRWLRA